MDGEEPPRVVLVDPTFLMCVLMIFCKKATHDIDHVNVITKVLITHLTSTLRVSCRMPMSALM